MSALALPARLDLPAAAPLRAELLTRRGAPLEISAAEVSHLGGLCLQVLASAALTWRADGQSLALVQPSEAFTAALATFGLPPEALCAGEAA